MYSTAIAYLLWFFSGFGAAGFHRFYLGKFGSGVLYLLTGGLFMVGSIYDLFTIPTQVREANLRVRYREALLSGIAPERGAQAPKKDSTERVILRTAKANRGRVTPSEVALEADIPIEEAKRELDGLVKKGHSEMRVSKSGTIVYVFQDFVTNPADLDLEDF